MVYTISCGSLGPAVREALFQSWSSQKRDLGRGKLILRLEDPDLFQCFIAYSMVNLLGKL